MLKGDIVCGLFNAAVSTLPSCMLLVEFSAIGETDGFCRRHFPACNGAKLSRDPTDILQGQLILGDKAYVKVSEFHGHQPTLSPLSL